MHPTTFIYSSHNMAPWMHRNFVVQPALEGHPDKRLLYLPMSEWPNDGDDYESQKFGWEKFAWYLNQFRNWGLRPQPFFWNQGLRRRDLEVLMELLINAPVVILGGGNTRLGMRRYRALGDMLIGDPHLFCRLLQDRQARGKVTVGFSAGADQLASVFGDAPEAEGRPCDGFGLARDIAVTLHHDWSRRDELESGARTVRHCHWFGLPNDSGLGINTGTLPSGLIWQQIRFVVDTSWDIPQEAFHIKTKQGLNIEHWYADGRSWSFNGGDAMLRIMSHDGGYRRSWMLVGGSMLDYDSQWPSQFHDFGSILAAHC